MNLEPIKSLLCSECLKSIATDSVISVPLWGGGPSVFVCLECVNED